MAISEETLRLHNRRTITVSGIIDDDTRRAVRGWARTWDQLASDFADALELAATQAGPGGRLSWRTANDVSRLSGALARAAAALDDLATAGRVNIVSDIGDVVDVATELTPQVIASQLPATVGPDVARLISGRMAGDTLDRIVDRTSGRITSLLDPLAADAEAAMRRELVRGIAVGDNPRVAARRMLDRLEGRFNGGLTRALRVARTEMLDAYRQSSAEIATTDADIVSKVVWTAALDTRTCPACVAMHGTEFPTGTAGPEGHPQCRCTFIEQTKTWRELGFAVEEPPSMFPDRDVWWDSLDDADRLQVMGPGRLAALESGEVGWDSLAQRKANVGWRDAYYVTPLKDLGVDQMAGAGA